MRAVVAQAIEADAERWSEAVLGEPRDAYVARVLHPDTWGSGVEIAILCEYFRVQAATFHMQSQSCIVSGETEPQRIYLLFDGIHYDLLAFAFAADAPREADVTLFDPADAGVEAKARRLVGELHARHEYIDVNKFTLRCLVCQEGLAGQEAARAHASATGHQSFAEYA